MVAPFYCHFVTSDLPLRHSGLRAYADRLKTGTATRRVRREWNVATILRIPSGSYPELFLLWPQPSTPAPNPRKGRDQILPSGILDHRWRHQHVKVETVETQEDEEEENVDINAVVQEAVVALVVEEEDDESESGFAFMPQHNNDCEETN